MGDRSWAANLPTFERPPVVEVAVGVEFVPLPGLSTIALVNLAQELWSDVYPIMQEQPPIPSRWSQGEIRVSTTPPAIRVWMLTDVGDELLQIQNDRLILNWRKVGSSIEKGEYPRYEYLRRRFNEIWVPFAYRADSGVFGALDLVTAEVTFVNQISPTPHAESPADVLSFVTNSPLFDAGISGGAVQFQVPIKDAEGAAIGVQDVASAFGSTPEGLAITLETTARVDVVDDSIDAVVGSLDRAHRSGVETFQRSTTKEMHRIWGIR